MSPSPGPNSNTSDRRGSLQSGETLCNLAPDRDLHWMALRLAHRAAFLRTPPRSCRISTAVRASAQAAMPAAAQGPVPEGVTANLATVQGLEPPALWSIFAEMSAIPRPSKHEGRVIAWLKDWAAARGLDTAQDAIGNLIIRRPGSGGGESAPPVILQGHVDMVTEKNEGTAHDFMADPIRLQRTPDGDWLTAEGTTLGADNGIGVCTALAVLDLPKDAKLPPLEVLCTIDEETGLTGAFQLDGSLLKGRTMINLDTEEWPEVFIGCAGGGDSVLTLTAELEEGPGGTAVEVAVSGLKGGHSGVEIHEDRGNAVRMAAAAVEAALAAAPGARLAGIAGGDKRNAIPRECKASLMVPSEEVDAVAAAVARVGADFAAEYGALEGELKVEASANGTAAPGPVLTPATAGNLLTLLLALPHGVVKYSHSVPGLVETSTNLASVKPGDGAGVFKIQCSTRSSLGPPLERVRGAIAKIAGLCGAAVEQDEAYPGWAPQPDAEIVALARECIAGVVGRQPQVKAIHAGLECGIIGEKLPGCASVSYGPTIKGAHSPDEMVQISTVKPFWESTLRLLEALADRR